MLERGVIEEKMKSTDVEFKPIAGYDEYYLISKHGSVYSARGRMLPHGKNAEGQDIVELRHKGKRELRVVKQLVQESWGDVCEVVEC